MLAFTDVMHLLADKFACLRRRRFALALVLARPFNRFSFRHNHLLGIICKRAHYHARVMYVHHSTCRRQPLRAPAHAHCLGGRLARAADPREAIAPRAESSSTRPPPQASSRPRG